MADTSENSGRRGRLALVAALAAGAILTAGAGYSMRATDQPAFCGACHVMREPVRTHMASTHARLACNECHAPHDLAGKIPFKAAAGTHDLLTTAFGRVDDVIHATSATREVLQDNCLRCHAQTNMRINLGVKERCTDCHRQVPHNRSTPIARRTAAHE